MPCLLSGTFDIARPRVSARSIAVDKGFGILQRHRTAGRRSRTTNGSSPFLRSAPDPLLPSAPAPNPRTPPPLHAPQTHRPILRRPHTCSAHNLPTHLPAHAPCERPLLPAVAHEETLFAAGAQNRRSTPRHRSKDACSRARLIVGASRSRFSEHPCLCWSSSTLSASPVVFRCGAWFYHGSRPDMHCLCNVPHSARIRSGLAGRPRSASASWCRRIFRRFRRIGLRLT